MHERLVCAGLATTVVGAAADGGAFLAFSAVVMPGLDRAAGIASAVLLGAAARAGAQEGPRPAHVQA